jgi:hypothetical protein
MPTRPDDSFHPQADNTLHGGISLREWYAGKALAGLVRMGDPADAAEQAVNLADALIARLSRPVRKSADDDGPMIDLALPSTPPSPLDNCF